MEIRICGLYHWRMIPSKPAVRRGYKMTGMLYEAPCAYEIDAPDGGDGAKWLLFKTGGSYRKHGIEDVQRSLNCADKVRLIAEIRMLVSVSA